MAKLENMVVDHFAFDVQWLHIKRKAIALKVTGNKLNSRLKNLRA